MIYNRHTHEELSYEHPNIITTDKIHVLPILIEKHAVVEIFLTEKRAVIIQSQHDPIRFGNQCGTRIHLGENYGKIDYNPKLIWNGKEWLVNTWGTFLFAEVELNVEPKECPCTSN